MKKRSAFDVSHPFFRPAWRRAAVVAFCLFWAGLEYVNGATFWATLFAAIAGFLFVQFFLRFDPADYDPKDEDRT